MSIKVNNGFLVGMDIGGTKTQIVDTLSTTVWRYATPDFKDIYELLDVYFEKMGVRPQKVVVGMAGPRDDATGDIKLTNARWPIFSPKTAAAHYRGTEFVTANDMVVTTAGVVCKAGTDLVLLRPGVPKTIGTKVVVTISTGIGVAAAVWDGHTKRHVIMPSEAGHIGFQPKNEDETRYLNYLLPKYPHPSAELSLSGKYGVEAVAEHILSIHGSAELRSAVQRAKTANRPLGAVLLEFATKGKGGAHEAAVRALDLMGSMIGSLLRDYAVAFKATGGIYLTGSVSLGLSEYFAEHTAMNARFVQSGSPHSEWIQDIPIYLLSDPYIAATGALALAQQ